MNVCVRYNIQDHTVSSEYHQSIIKTIFIKKNIYIVFNLKKNKLYRIYSSNTQNQKLKVHRYKSDT